MSGSSWATGSFEESGGESRERFGAAKLRHEGEVAELREALFELNSALEEELWSRGLSTAARTRAWRRLLSARQNARRLAARNRQSESGGES